MLFQHGIVPHGFVRISNDRTEQPNRLLLFNHHRRPVFMDKIDDCQGVNAHENDPFSFKTCYCRYDITGGLRDCEIHYNRTMANATLY